MTQLLSIRGLRTYFYTESGVARAVGTTEAADVKVVKAKGAEAEAAIHGGTLRARA